MHRQMKLKPKIGLKQNITNENGGRYRCWWGGRVGGTVCVLKIENYQKENKNNSDNSVNNKLINVTATRERCEQKKGNYIGRRGREGGREGVVKVEMVQRELERKVEWYTPYIVYSIGKLELDSRLGLEEFRFNFICSAVISVCPPSLSLLQLSCTLSTPLCFYLHLNLWLRVAQRLSFSS